MEWFFFSSMTISFLFLFSIIFFLLLPFFQFSSAKEKRREISILPVGQESEYLERTIDTLLRESRKKHSDGYFYIFLVNCGADEETEKLCLCLCRRWKDVVLYYSQISIAEKAISELLIANNIEF